MFSKKIVVNKFGGRKLMEIPKFFGSKNVRVKENGGEIVLCLKNSLKSKLPITIF